jgi:hypothetical protein
LRRILLASAVLFAFCGSAALGAQHAERTSHAARRSGRTAALRYLEGKLQRYEALTWHWQELAGMPRTQTAGRTLAAMAVSDLEQTVKTWQRRAQTAHRVAQHPPHLQDWMCIHRYEGAWNDVGGPYWGGLQMSLSFQETYGSRLFKTKGTADHWTPLEQMWTAEKALRSRGFWPWPNTARLCGLI